MKMLLYRKKIIWLGPSYRVGTDTLVDTLLSFPTRASMGYLTNFSPPVFPPHQPTEEVLGLYPLRSYTALCNNDTGWIHGRESGISEDMDEKYPNIRSTKYQAHRGSEGTIIWSLETSVSFHASLSKLALSWFEIPPSTKWSYSCWLGAAK